MSVKDTIIRYGKSTRPQERQRALDLIVSTYFRRPSGLRAIIYDRNFRSPPYDIETGFARLRQPQTIKVGPRFFTQWPRRIDRRIRTVGHELLHVRQRTGNKPIANKFTREFLAIHWTITARIRGVAALGRAQTLQYITQRRGGALAQWGQMPAADQRRYRRQHREVLQLQQRLTRRRVSP